MDEDEERKGKMLSRVVLTGVGATVTEVDVTVVVDGVIERHEQALETSAEAYCPSHGGRFRFSRGSARADRFAEGGVGKIVFVLEG